MSVSGRKILGQNVTAGASVLQDLYVVPAYSEVEIHNIFICNTTGAALTFVLALAQAGSPDNTLHHIYHNQSVGANGTFVIPGTIQMAAGDKLRFSASAAGMSATVVGQQFA